jgi:hypothetical protein
MNVLPAQTGGLALAIWNRAHGLARSLLLISGWTLIALAVLRPFAQMWLLPASSSLSTSLFLMMAFAINLVTGLVFLAVSVIRRRSWIWDTFRMLVGALAAVILFVNLLSWGTTFWFAYIAPRMEIVVPDDFLGTAVIRIKHPLKPSLETAGQTYLYEIPPGGILERDSGWLGTPMLGFSFENGFSRPGAGYKAFIRRANGTPLHSDEFDFRFGDPGQRPVTDTLHLEIKPR